MLKKKVSNYQVAKFIMVVGMILLVESVLSLFIGKYPISVTELLGKDSKALRVFWTLRFPRTCMAVLGGFGLGVTGMIYQIVFRNPLASPDIVGVSSGASAGAAFAILFLAGSPFGITTSAFLGSLAAVGMAIGLSYLTPGKSTVSVVLSGLAVHSIAQAVLMVLKLSADPEKQLASIEFWIMGGLNGITIQDLPIPFFIIALAIFILFILYRQVLLLSVEEEEAALLGMPVRKMRFCILLLATLIVSSIVSVTGLISFVGLLAPHCARLIAKDHRVWTLGLSGLLGGSLLCFADILARSVAASELPVSIFTSLIGAPFLIYLIYKHRTL